MAWNYRVIEFMDPNDGPWQAIHEVHYDEQGRPVSYSENPAPVMSSDDGGNEASLSWVLDRMRDALSRPVLVEKDFYEPDAPYDPHDPLFREEAP